MNKKIITIIITAIIILGAAACSKTGNNGNNQEYTIPEEYTVAYITTLPQSTIEQAVYNQLEALLETTNGRLIYIPQNNENSVTAVENAISAGASGIIICPCSDDEITDIIELCNNNRTYFVFQNYQVDDEEVANKLNKCMYYAGRTYTDQQEQAKCIVDVINNDDVGKIALVLGNNASKTALTLENEFRLYCAKSGIQIREEISMPLEDEFFEETIEDWLIYSTEIEGIVVLNQGDTEACERTAKIITKFVDYGCRIYTNEEFDNMEKLFETKKLAVVSTNNSVVDVLIPGVLITNEILTTKWTKSKPIITIPVCTITNTDEANSWINEVSSDNTDQIKEKFISYYNKNTSVKDLQNYADTQDIG